MSTHSPVDIGDLCIDCYAKGIKRDTTKEGFVNRIPAETDEYSGYMCGPCADESSDYLDKMHAEEDLADILKDALFRIKASLGPLPCDLGQIENVCRIYGYETLIEDSNSIDKVNKEERQNQRLLNEESWRAGYDVLTEGALGDYPEE